MDINNEVTDIDIRLDHEPDEQNTLNVVVDIRLFFNSKAQTSLKVSLHPGLSGGQGPI